jgi:hypothetical protein
MISSIIKEYDSKVHDNRITSFSVDFINKVLQLNTQWEEKEITTITFTGLLAHKFENVIEYNIILDLYEVTVESFIKNEKEQLDESLKYGFPSMKSMNIMELEKSLSTEKYKIFYMESSLGLCGYIIAKDIIIDVQEK